MLIGARGYSGREKQEEVRGVDSVPTKGMREEYVHV